MSAPSSASAATITQPRWSSLLALSAATFYVAALGWLAVFAAGPAFFLKWQPVVISSGSMQPLIQTGDVVLIEDIESSEDLQPSNVITFRDPSRNGTLVTHRIETVNDDGTFTTRGDANGFPDMTPVSPEAVEGRGAYLVPMIGMPVTWLAKGQLLAFALWAGVTIMAIGWVMTKPEADSHSDKGAAGDSAGGDVAGPEPHERQPRTTAGVPAAASAWSALPIGALSPLGSFRNGTHNLRDRVTSGANRLLGRRLARFVGIGLVLALIGGIASVSLAAFTSASANEGNSLAAAMVAPPSNLQLSASCTAASPIQFRAATTANGTSTSITLARPVGTVAGDTMLAHIVLRDDVALTAPAGWRLVRRSTTGPFSALYLRTAAVTDVTSYTWTAASNGRFAAGLGTWTNVSEVTPIDAHGGQSGNGSSIVAPSLTTTVPNTMLVAFWSIRDDSGVTIPAGMTQRWQVNSNQAGAKHHQVQTTAGTEPFPGPGATGTRTAVSPSSQDNVGQMVALRPTSGGGASVTAKWTATPSATADGYKLQRWLGGVQETEQTITPRTATMASDTTVTSGLTYTYRLAAFDNTWRSTELSGDVSVPTC